MVSNTLRQLLRARAYGVTRHQGIKLINWKAKLIHSVLKFDFIVRLII